MSFGGGLHSFSGDNRATYPNQTTYDALRANPQFGQLGGVAGSAAPDLTDDMVRRKRAAAAFAALSGQGRASTMTGGSTTLTAGSNDLGKTFLGGL